MYRIFYNFYQFADALIHILSAFPVSSYTVPAAL